jgi:hypothetical protein
MITKKQKINLGQNHIISFNFSFNINKEVLTMYENLAVDCEVKGVKKAKKILDNENLPETKERKLIRENVLLMFFDENSKCYDVRGDKDYLLLGTFSEYYKNTIEHIVEKSNLPNRKDFFEQLDLVRKKDSKASFFCYRTKNNEGKLVFRVVYFIKTTVGFMILTVIY